MMLLRCRRAWLGYSFYLCLLASGFTSPEGSTDRAAHLDGKIKPIQLGPSVYGRFIRNVGNLQMNVTNWGFFGSLPKSNYPMADQPSVDLLET